MISEGKIVTALLGCLLAVGYVRWLYGQQLAGISRAAGAGSPAPPASVAAELPTDPGLPFLAEAHQRVEAGDLEGAREVLVRLLAEHPRSASVRRAEELLGRVHIELLLSPGVALGKLRHVIRRGDSLARIAQEHGTTIELIQRINGIEGTVIHAGQPVFVCPGRFSVEVSRTARELRVLRDGAFFKRYRVGIGRGGLTPTGAFKIIERTAAPSWWSAGREIPYGDPANILGTHWLGLTRRRYGIHGTWEPQSVGQELSSGCIRLANEDAAELYALLPLGSEVIIRE